MLRDHTIIQSVFPCLEHKDQITSPQCSIGCNNSLYHLAKQLHNGLLQASSFTSLVQPRWITRTVFDTVGRPAPLIAEHQF